MAHFNFLDGYHLTFRSGSLHIWYPFRPICLNVYWRLDSASNPILFGMDFHGAMTPTTDIKTISPGISKDTVEAFTISFIILYALIFLLVYIQLILVLCYKYKRLSYQTVLLFLCLFWAGLRTVLFSVFIQDVNKASVKPNSIQHWILYSFPVCLQYTILCLLVLYFAQVSLCFIIPLRFFNHNFLLVSNFK